MQALFSPESVQSKRNTEAIEVGRNMLMAGRESGKSLYSSTLVTFEDDKGAYDQKDAEGFIRLNALRLRTLGMRRKKFDK